MFCYYFFSDDREEESGTGLVNQFLLQCGAAIRHGFQKSTTTYGNVTHESSLSNSHGKGALGALLSLATFIAQEHVFIPFCLIEVNGQGSYAPGVKLNCFEFGKVESALYHNNRRPWPPTLAEGYGINKVPDIICKHQLRVEDPFKDIIIGEVKSSSDMRCKMLDRSFKQAWVPALSGLKESDETYGILFYPSGAKLFQLKVGKALGKSYLITRVEGFPFLQKAAPTFNVDELIKLLKQIIAIFLRLPPCVRP